MQKQFLDHIMHAYTALTQCWRKAYLFYEDFYETNDTELEVLDGFTRLASIGPAPRQHLQGCCNLVVHLKHLLIVEVVILTLLSLCTSK